MPCPNCDHTMEAVGHRADDTVFWCPRCGTIATPILHDVTAPKLVERCREFEQRLTLVAAGDTRCWRTLGIAESINTPENRPQ